MQKAWGLYPGEGVACCFSRVQYIERTCFSPIEIQPHIFKLNLCRLPGSCNKMLIAGFCLPCDRSSCQRATLAVHEEMRAEGALCMADEVQCGFGRYGSAFWAQD